MVNKFCKFAMFMLCINSMCGCSTKIRNEVDFIPVDNEESTYSEYILPTDYNFENAKKDGYVIYNNDGTIINEDKIEDFYNKSSNNENVVIHIIRYTIEGDPVVSTYVYKDSKYMLFIDNSRDEFAIDKKIDEKEIRSIELSLDSDGRKVIIQKY